MDEKEKTFRIQIHTGTSQSTLICSLEWWDGLALILIEGRCDDSSVSDVDLAVWFLLPCERVLHPVDIVTVGEIFAGVGAAGFLSLRCSFGGLDA
jgi:hypothetical protein